VTDRRATDPHGDSYLRRSAAASDFETTFAAVDEFVVAAGPARALSLARAWTRECETEVQAAGLDVLATLAVGKFDVAGAAATALIEAAAAVPVSAPAEDLRWSAAHGLACLAADHHQERRRILDELLRFQDDPDPDVRWQVVLVLPDLAVPEQVDDDVATAALVRRLSDPDGGVRDWAAFGVGLLRADSPEIRASLLDLLRRPEEDAAGEAAVALAQLAEPAVLPAVLAQLDVPDVGNLWVQAAAALGDPSLLPVLQRLANRKWAEDSVDERDLQNALDACRPQKGLDPDRDARGC